jgi:hypothetical protein
MFGNSRLGTNEFITYASRLAYPARRPQGYRTLAEAPKTQRGAFVGQQRAFWWLGWLEHFTGRNGLGYKQERRPWREPEAACLVETSERATS